MSRQQGPETTPEEPRPSDADLTEAQLRFARIVGERLARIWCDDHPNSPAEIDRHAEEPD